MNKEYRTVKKNQLCYAKRVSGLKSLFLLTSVAQESLSELQLVFDYSVTDCILKVFSVSLTNARIDSR